MMVMGILVLDGSSFGSASIPTDESYSNVPVESCAENGNKD
jgi:hypothetical protein